MFSIRAEDTRQIIFDMIDKYETQKSHLFVLTHDFCSLYFSLLICGRIEYVM